MKKLLFAFLMLSVYAANAQLNAKISLGIQLQPEITFHKNQLTFEDKGTYLKATYNTGIATSLQYKVSKNIFVDFGVSFISRNFKANLVFDQSKLPAPYTSLSKELNYTKMYAYNLFQFPINIGYSFVNKKALKVAALVGISPNFLHSAAYKAGGGQYDRTYKKGYWQGVSYNIGVAADIPLTKKIIFTNAIQYSFKNTLRKDEFLGGFGDESYVLPYNYLRYNVGVKIPLKK
jgi:Outer membrane protein beta-barrel domain